MQKQNDYKMTSAQNKDYQKRNTYTPISKDTKDFIEECVNIPIRKPKEHLGRNDKCVCGSQKKFKHCCLPKIQAGK